MRKLVDLRIARAVFCLTVAIFGASAQAYKCNESYAVKNVDHWYSWFQPSRDCSEIVKQTFPTPTENVDKALELLGQVTNVSASICESPLILKAMAQSARVNKASEMVTAMQLSGCDHTDDKLILEGDHAAIEFLQKNAPKLLTGESGKALYSAKISLMNLETLSELNLNRALRANDGLDFLRERFSAALVRKAFDQIADYKWSDDTRARVRHLLRNHSQLFLRLPQHLYDDNDNEWRNPTDAFAILAARPNHGMEAGLLQDILNSDWDINLKLNRRANFDSCDMSGRTPFLKWIETGRFGLVRLAIGLAKPNFTPFGLNGATAYLLAYRGYIQRDISETDLDFIGRYSKLSPVQPKADACSYPASYVSRNFLTLEQLARLPENEKTTDNLKFIMQLKSLLLEKPETLAWTNQYVFPLKKLFSPDVCHILYPDDFQTLILQAQVAHVKLDPDSLVLCTQSLMTSIRTLPKDDAKLTLLILKLESLGYPMTSLKLDAAQPLQAKVQQYLRALGSSTDLRRQRLLAQLHRANGDAVSALVQSVTLNGTSVSLLADKLTDADYDLIEKPELKNFAQAMLDIHGRAPSVMAADQKVAQSILSAVVAQKPDLTSLKMILENQVELSLNKTRIWYNLNSVNVYDYLASARLQCYSATSTFEIAAALGVPDTQRVSVVIYTEGHVLPGYLTRGARGWQLTGIETTATGEATILFGLTSAITTPMNVIEAPDFFVAEVFKNKFSAPSDYIAAVEKRMVERYGFNPATFKKAVETSAPRDSQTEKLNASLFGFGVPHVAPGDLLRTSGAKLKPDAYSTGAVAAPRSRTARARPGPKRMAAMQGASAGMAAVKTPPEVVWLNRALSILSERYHFNNVNEFENIPDGMGRILAHELYQTLRLQAVGRRSKSSSADCLFDEGVRSRLATDDGELPGNTIAHGYLGRGQLTVLSLEVDGEFLGACVVQSAFDQLIPFRLKPNPR